MLQTGVPLLKLYGVDEPTGNLPSLNKVELMQPSSEKFSGSAEVASNFMKWRGDDALRADATRRFVLEGQAGLGVGRSADVNQQRATAGRILGGDGQGDQGDGVAGGGDGRADPRRYADRARDVSGRARDDGASNGRT